MECFQSVAAQHVRAKLQVSQQTHQKLLPPKPKLPAGAVAAAPAGGGAKPASSKLAQPEGADCPPSVNPDGAGNPPAVISALLLLPAVGSSGGLPPKVLQSRGPNPPPPPPPLPAAQGDASIASGALKGEAPKPPVPPSEASTLLNAGAGGSAAGAGPKELQSCGAAAADACGAALALPKSCRQSSAR